MKRLIYFIAIFLLLGVGITSCRSIKYVPIETVKHDSVYINKIKYDSIYLKDSIYMLVKGDTVYKYQLKYRYRDKLVRDTVHVTKIDSVQVPYPVEKNLTKWQQMKIELGGWAFGVVLIVIGWLIYKKIIL